MPTLLLPAPVFHQCALCRISSEYPAPADGEFGYRSPFFVERIHVYEDGEAYDYELCDLCDKQRREEEARPAIYLCKGVTPWASFPDYVGYEQTPLICVSSAPVEAWGTDSQDEHETWLFCRTRQEWRVAWQLARILVKNGNRPLLYPHLLRRLPAYRVPGDEDIWINGEDNIIDCQSPSEWGFSGRCEGCGDQSNLLTLWPATQWANCPRCHQAVRSFQLATKGGY